MYLNLYILSEVLPNMHLIKKHFQNCVCVCVRAGEIVDIYTYATAKKEYPSRCQDCVVLS